MSDNISQRNKKFVKKLILNIVLIIVSFFLFLLSISVVSASEYYDDFLYVMSFIGVFISPIWTIFEIVRLIILLTKKYRSSAKYHEKCYKQINRIHTYCENGSITEEEFNKLKQKILNQICD